MHTDTIALPMPTPTHNELGRLISTHGISPVFLQRAAIVATISFLFFMAGLLFFYIQQSIAYFVLSTAFLVVYIFTMVGWVLQKKNIVQVYENGLTYKKFGSLWNDLKSVRSDSRAGITLVKTDGETITISRTIADVEKIAVAIRGHLPS
jgi:hypothetical protein